MIGALPEVWAGPECSWLRVGDWACDQLALTGHDRRIEDLDLLRELGVNAVRYPVLWGRTARRDEATDWDWAGRRLERLVELGIRPIVGLLHHGFGPDGMDPLDPGWPAAFGRYAAEVAQRFPFVADFLPVNEPLTTARFGGLYGWWPPYGRDRATFTRLMFAQAEAYLEAAQSIRSISPHARILVNEDLGRTVGSPACEARAERHTQRRWLTFDLLCGHVEGIDPWQLELTGSGDRRALDRLRWESEPPDVLGIDYYVTSDRYVDADVARYPAASHAADEHGAYADVELARVADVELGGFGPCLRETWARYRRPVALTEVHLAGEPEDQVAWWAEAVEAASRSISAGIPVAGITAWSAFGAFEWSSVLRNPCGSYAPGCFEARDHRSAPALTPLGEAVRATALGESVRAPRGWWRRADRALYEAAMERQAA
jgi:dTDP-4-dehydrorhamnose reductase